MSSVDTQLFLKFKESAFLKNHFKVNSKSKRNLQEKRIYYRYYYVLRYIECYYDV